MNETNDSIGLIEIESLIKYTHKVLLNNLMGVGTPPGHFSTYERDAEFNGKIHKYPKFENETFAEQAMQTLVDKINDMLESIRLNSPEELKIKYYFKCASLFLFCFLTLHPFGDGNGRLARLLSGYILLTFSPFFSPIYNIFGGSSNDYIQALIDARLGMCDENRISTRDEAVKFTISLMHKKPCDLCSMIIESNWAFWKKIFVKVGDRTL